MLNRITLMGRLVADPDMHTTTSGVSVATVRLAVDRDFKNKQTGEKEADFFNVVAWRNTADFVGKYFTKGRMAVVEGRLQSRNYDDKDGNRRTAVEIVADNFYFADSKRDGDAGQVPPQLQAAADTWAAAQNGGLTEVSGSDGDLPF